MRMNIQILNQPNFKLRWLPSSLAEIVHFLVSCHLELLDVVGAVFIGSCMGFPGDEVGEIRVNWCGFVGVFFFSAKKGRFSGCDVVGFGWTQKRGLREERRKKGGSGGLAWWKGWWFESCWR